MKRFLIATIMTLWLGLGPANKAHAQIVYGYSVPMDDGGGDSSGLMYNPSGYFPGSSGYSGMMMNSPWGYTPGSYGNTGTMNRSWSSRMSGSKWGNGSNWGNGFGSGGTFSRPNTSMSSFGMNAWSGSMNSGFGGWNGMWMRRR
jgi:hypothetical protein